MYLILRRSSDCWSSERSWLPARLLAKLAAGRFGSGLVGDADRRPLRRLEDAEEQNRAEHRHADCREHLSPPFYPVE